MMAVGVAVLVRKNPARMSGILFVGFSGFEHIENFTSQGNVPSLVCFDRESFRFAVPGYPSFGVHIVRAFSTIDIPPLCNGDFLFPTRGV